MAPPPPDSAEADVDQRAASPDADSPDVADVARDQTAPPATSTEIVTEADDPAAASAPTQSLRPKARPQQLAAVAPAPAQAAPATADPVPAAQADAADAPASAAPSVDDALAAALAEALGGPLDAPSPATDASGPPLSGGERDAFRIAVQRCWNVDVGAQAANVTVTVAFELDRDGKVVGNRVRLISANGGTGASQDTAFQAARRAVLRCQLPNGYDLPADKFEQWQQVEMVFNPAEMRLR